MFEWVFNRHTHTLTRIYHIYKDFVGFVNDDALTNNIYYRMLPFTIFFFRKIKRVWSQLSISKQRETKKLQKSSWTKASQKKFGGKSFWQNALSKLVFSLCASEVPESCERTTAAQKWLNKKNKKSGSERMRTRNGLRASVWEREGGGAHEWKIFVQSLLIFNLDFVSIPFVQKWIRKLNLLKI